MFFYTVILTNEYVNANVQNPSVTIVKAEHVDVLVLFDYEDEICIAVDFSYTPPFTLRSTNSIMSKLHEYSKQFWIVLQELYLCKSSPMP